MRRVDENIARGWRFRNARVPSCLRRYFAVPDYARDAHSTSSGRRSQAWLWLESLSVPIPVLSGVKMQQLLRTVLFGMSARGCEGAPLSLGLFLGRRPWGSSGPLPTPVELRGLGRVST